MNHLLNSKYLLTDIQRDRTFKRNFMKLREKKIV